MSKKIRIALFSPNKNPYSETFIQAHKNNLKDKVYYYYGRAEAIALEGHPPLAKKATIYLFKIFKNLAKKSPSFVREQLVTKSLKKNKIDVVLVEYGIHAHHILPIVKKAKLPLVVHFHGYDATVKKIIEGHNYYKEVFAYASKVIAVSTAMKQLLVDMGCPANKVVYNANAAQDKFFEIQPNFTKKQLISVGRFTHKKAPYYTILAFKEALKKHPDAKLLLAGDGVLIEVCKNLVNHYGLENEVQFLGVIKPDQLIELLQESRAYIQHSITASNGDTEGMPISVLEASAAGLPVISTYHAGISDVIENEVTGLLSQEHDVSKMTSDIIKVLDDVEFAKQLGNSGKDRIKDHFSFTKHIDGIQKILEESIS